MTDVRKGSFWFRVFFHQTVDVHLVRAVGSDETFDMPDSFLPLLLCIFVFVSFLHRLYFSSRASLTRTLDLIRTSLHLAPFSWPQAPFLVSRLLSCHIALLYNSSPTQTQSRSRTSSDSSSCAAMHHLNSSPLVRPASLSSRPPRDLHCIAASSFSSPPPAVDCVLFVSIARLIQVSFSSVSFFSPFSSSSSLQILFVHSHPRLVSLPFVSA